MTIIKAGKYGQPYASFLRQWTEDFLVMSCVCENDVMTALCSVAFVTIIFDEGYTVTPSSLHNL